MSCARVAIFLGFTAGTLSCALSPVTDEDLTVDPDGDTMHDAQGANPDDGEDDQDEDGDGEDEDGYEDEPEAEPEEGETDAGAHAPFGSSGSRDIRTRNAGDASAAGGAGDAGDADDAGDAGDAGGLMSGDAGDASARPSTASADGRDAGSTQDDAGSIQDDAAVPASVRDAGLVTPTRDGGTAAASGASARCQAGVYAGVFSGQIQALLGVVRLGISGTVRVEVAAGATSGVIEVQNGTLDGTDAEGNPIRARLSARLNCAEKQLENGRITDGVYTRVDPIWRVPLRAHFVGTVAGRYGASPPSVAGSWEVFSDLFGRSGGGTFSTRLE